jgi:hypothetical protein
MSTRKRLDLSAANLLQIGSAEGAMQNKLPVVEQPMLI